MGMDTTWLLGIVGIVAAAIASGQLLARRRALATPESTPSSAAPGRRVLVTGIARPLDEPVRAAGSGEAVLWATSTNVYRGGQHTDGSRMWLGTVGTRFRLTDEGDQGAAVTVPGAEVLNAELETRLLTKPELDALPTAPDGTQLEVSPDPGVMHPRFEGLEEAVVRHGDRIWVRGDLTGAPGSLVFVDRPRPVLYDRTPSARATTLLRWASVTGLVAVAAIVLLVLRL